MPELDFRIVDAEPARHAATPTLHFKLEINQGVRPVPIRNVSLQCQIRIETKQRSYAPQEQQRLTDLFGEPSRWSQTLHSMLWTRVNVTVPAFDKQCTVDLPVPCSFDFNLSATKYFHGLDDGEVPLEILFSGSTFYTDPEGGLAMELISWNKETAFKLPVKVWKDMIDVYYPNQAWLCLNRQVFDALYEYKRRQGYTGFDEALTSLLANVKREAS